MYTAVVLYPGPIRKTLIAELDALCPEAKEWELIAHHVTLKMGSAGLTYAHALDKPCVFTVDAWGRLGHRVVAVRVTELTCNGQRLTCTRREGQLHVTMRLNRSVGAKPVESNKITNWVPFSTPFTMNGRLQQC